MKQKDRAKKLSGAEGFESYYAGLFGERWQKIKAAFSKSPDYVEWKAGGAESYFLDSASVRAAGSLPLSGAKKILDMCAAPGGKTLVLASNMDDDAILFSNERSPERKRRLDRTVQTCLPEEISSRVKTSCKDGAKLCLESQNLFDRILLDAPCSSERHVLADPKYLSEWSPSRIKTLSVSQWALLSSAWRILAPGGFMVYSTCALSPDENDKVISKLLKKFDDVEIIEPKISLEYKKFISSNFSENEFPKKECSKTELDKIEFPKSEFYETELDRIELPKTESANGELSEKKFAKAGLSRTELPEYEKTEFGAHILPDFQTGSDFSDNDEKSSDSSIKNNSEHNKELISESDSDSEKCSEKNCKSNFERNSERSSESSSGPLYFCLLHKKEI